MAIVLDASATLSWLVNRTNPAEAQLAREVLHALRREDAVVPLLWYAEVTNGILVAERRQICNREQSALFLTMLGELTIVDDEKRPAVTQLAMLDLARTYGLTGYDATYLELVLRTGCALVTFDRQLADATRKAGGRVFGDPE